MTVLDDLFSQLAQLSDRRHRASHRLLSAADASSASAPRPSSDADGAIFPTIVDWFLSHVAHKLRTPNSVNMTRSQRPAADTVGWTKNMFRSKLLSMQLSTETTLERDARKWLLDVTRCIRHLDSVLTPPPSTLSNSISITATPIVALADGESRDRLARTAALRSLLVHADNSGDSRGDAGGDVTGIGRRLTNSPLPTVVGAKGAAMEHPAGLKGHRWTTVSDGTFLVTADSKSRPVERPGTMHHEGSRKATRRAVRLRQDETTASSPSDETEEENALVVAPAAHEFMSQAKVSAQLLSLLDVRHVDLDPETRAHLEAAAATLGPPGGLALLPTPVAQRRSPRSMKRAVLPFRRAATPLFRTGDGSSATAVSAMDGPDWNAPGRPLAAGRMEGVGHPQRAAAITTPALPSLNNTDVVDEASNVIHRPDAHLTRYGGFPCGYCVPTATSGLPSATYRAKDLRAILQTRGHCYNDGGDDKDKAPFHRRGDPTATVESVRARHVEARKALPRRLKGLLNLRPDGTHSTLDAMALTDGRAQGASPRGDVELREQQLAELWKKVGAAPRPPSSCGFGSRPATPERNLHQDRAAEQLHVKGKPPTPPRSSQT